MKTKPARKARPGLDASKQRPEPISLPIKYVFLDVVNFTKGRSTEAQVEILQHLKAAVRSVIRTLKLSPKKRIYLPTGDGMCIALIDVSQPFDVHIQLAVNLIGLLHKQNSKLTDETEKFQVRIGLNECDDTLVDDINDSRNVAGLGVNLASRIMDLADASQILISASVHERLRTRRKYMSKFREFGTEIKHGEVLYCFQYIDAKIEGLSHDVPKAFQEEEVKPVVIPPLNGKIAAYIALCVKHRAELVEILNSPIHKNRLFAKVILWFMAEDYDAAKTAPEYKKASTKTQGEGESFSARLKLYDATDLWVALDFQKLLSDKFLLSVRDCFEPNSEFLVPSAQGLSRLNSECPWIAQDFGLLPKLSEILPVPGAAR